MFADRAQELGIKPDVGLFLSEYSGGGRRWRRKVNEYDKKRIKELKAMGYTNNKITRVLGIWPDSIKYYMEKEART